MDGGVALHLCGEPRRLRLTWGALTELRSLYGAEFQERINAAMVSEDFQVLAEVLSAATGRALTAAEIFADSPPIVATVRALHMAFNVAYHGPTGKPAEEAKAARGPLAIAGRLAGSLRAILSKTLLALGSMLAGRGASFSG